MRKILLLFAAVIVSMTASAKYNFDLSAMSIWDSSDKVTISGGTITYTEAWRGVSLWTSPDLSGYTHIYVRLAGNCEFDLTAQQNDGEKVTYGIGASTEGQVITFPIPGDASKFGGFGFQAKETGSVTIQEISAVTLTADLTSESFGLTSGDVSVWPGTVGENNCTAATKMENGVITMGTYSSGDNWGGVQWWLAWNNDTSSNSGQDYSDYDGIVVTFSSATTSGGNIKVTYRYGTDAEQATTSYAGFSSGSNYALVPLHPTLKSHMSCLVIEGPQGAVYNIASIKRYKKRNCYFPLAPDATTYITATDGAVVELNRSLKAGWSSVCLPFETTPGAFAAGAKAYKMDSYDGSNLQFTEVTTMEAHKPYILYSESAIAAPVVFAPVNVVAGDAGNFITAGFACYGNYTPAFDMEGKYGLASGTIRKGGSGSKLGAYSAYFTAVSGANFFNIAFDDETTGIQAVEDTFGLNGGRIYDLQGRELKAPQKGLNIINGKKVIIK